MRQVNVKSVRRYQRDAALQHCRMIVGIEEKAKKFPSANAVRDYWMNRQNPDTSPTINLGSDRPLTARQLQDFEKEFVGVSDAYFYGPMSTMLWEAISNGPNARETLFDLSIVLGVHQDVVKNFTDEEKCFLAEYFPYCCGMYVFAYQVHQLCQHYKDAFRGKASIVDGEGQLRHAGTSIDTYFIFEELADFLALYQLDRETVLDMIDSNHSWYDQKNKPERMYPPEQTAFVKYDDGRQCLLGVYTLYIMEQSKSTGLEPGQYFLEYEAENIEIIWKTVM